MEKDITVKPLPSKSEIIRTSTRPHHTNRTLSLRVSFLYTAEVTPLGPPLSNIFMAAFGGKKKKMYQFYEDKYYHKYVGRIPAMHLTSSFPLDCIEAILIICYLESSTEHYIHESHPQ
jgi:hypothetical protein